ncbi:immunoglobulin-like domain-containing protein, partial [Aliarcobacter butzleri]
ITLTGSEVIEGGQITITASVDNKVTGEDLVITLDNGKTITIPVGETTGKVEYDSRADDAYKQGTDSQTVKISGTTGGNFEALDTTSTTTVVVKDDSDVTKITLTGSEVIEGGQITITASVDNKVT